MPKTREEWVLFFAAALIAVIFSINIVFSVLGLTGSVAVGFQDKFDWPTIILISYFSYLLIGEIATMVLLRSEKIFESLWPNLIIVSSSLGYFSMACFLLYGLWIGELSKYFWTIMIISSWLIIANLPSIIIHLILCIQKFRIRAHAIDQGLQTRSKINLESDEELWTKLNKLPGGDVDPFDTPYGPTANCLSDNQVVSFVQNGKDDEIVVKHLISCEACFERINRYKKTVR